MEEYEKTHALLMKVRRSRRFEQIKQYSLVAGGTLLAVGASVLLVKETQKNN